MFDHANHSREFDLADRLAELLPEVSVAPPLTEAAQPEARGFELPARIWGIMIGCYGVFLGALTIALGSNGRALFAIVISLVYVVVFFAASRLLMAQNPARAPSPLDRNGVLMTHFGPMDRKAVYGQILVVPVAVALFGLAVSAIILSVQG